MAGEPGLWPWRRIGNFGDALCKHNLESGPSENLALPQTKYLTAVPELVFGKVHACETDLIMAVKDNQS